MSSRSIHWHPLSRLVIYYSGKLAVAWQVSHADRRKPDAVPMWSERGSSEKSHGMFHVKHSISTSVQNVSRETVNKVY